MDDDASHTRAAIMLTSVGKDIREKFLEHREIIMYRVATACWPNDVSFREEKWKESIQRKHVKILFHAKDMRGSTQAWCQKHNIPDVSPVINTLITLPDETIFSVKAYFEAISKGLDDIESRWERTTHFISQWKNTWNRNNKASEPTMQSYLRQEYEAVSLAVKIHTATCLQGMGVKPINLQHDGLVMTAGKVNPENIQNILTQQCSNSLGYSQPVHIKNMPVHGALGTSLLTTRYIPYHEAVECSIFMSEYAPPPMGDISQRGALEKKATAWAAHGFKQIKHLLTSDGKTFLSAKAFFKMQSPPRIPKPETAL